MKVISHKTIDNVGNNQIKNCRKKEKTDRYCHKNKITIKKCDHFLYMTSPRHSFSEIQNGAFCFPWKQPVIKTNDRYQIRNCGETENGTNIVTKHDENQMWSPPLMDSMKAFFNAIILSKLKCFNKQCQSKHYFWHLKYCQMYR